MAEALPASRAGSGAGSTTASVPRANRLGRPSWLDPRLVAGIVLIAIAVLAGARVVSGAGHTTEVWSLRHDLGAGSELTTADLVPAAVHFAGSDVMGRYLPAGSALPAGARVARSVDAGELLPRAAVSTASGPRVAVPLAVDSAALPPGLVAGTMVDVWAVPDRSGSAGTGAGITAAGATTAEAVAVQVLSGVPVAAVTGSGALGTTGTTVVTVSIPRDARAVATVLGLVAGHSIIVLPVSDLADQPAPATLAPATPAPATSGTPTPGASGTR